MYGCLFMKHGSDAADDSRKSKNGTYKSGGRLPNVFRQRFRNNIRAFSYASVDTHASAVNAGITLSELRCGNG